jgi:poly-gamma-glutamate synthesis protein (capsule biosynthesis protein)
MKRKIMRILTLLITIMMLVSCSGIPDTGDDAHTVLLDESKPELEPSEADEDEPSEDEVVSGDPLPEPEHELEPEPDFLTVSFLAAGDNLIHSPIYNQGARYAEGTDADYDFTFIYQRVAPLIAAADLSVINQETIFTDIFPPSNFPFFNSPTALGDHMIDIGFNVFGIANNHTLDKGMEGLYACLDYWDSRYERYGAIAVGAYRDAEDRANIRTNEINGIVFSYLSYAESLNGLDSWLHPPAEVGCANDVERMIEEIMRAKKSSDVCVVFLHWGVENSHIIGSGQRDVARRLVDAGADIIVGTHPHVLRDFEVFEREDGTKGVVAYSLGNFIGAQRIPRTMIGGLLKFDIVLDYKTREVVFEDIRLVPTITHYDSSFRNIRIYPLSEYTAETALLHGVREHGRFDMDYILAVINETMSEEFLR